MGKFNSTPTLYLQAFRKTLKKKYGKKNGSHRLRFPKGSGSQLHNGSQHFVTL